MTMPLPSLAERAEDVFAALDRLFHLKDGRYRLHPGADQQGFAWDQGVLLSAFAAMAANAPDARQRADYAGRLARHVRALESDFWREEGPVPGFNASPKPSGLDRYYDDNAWIGLALYDAADLLKDTSIRQRAHRTLDFVLSGNDRVLGGGIWWQEPHRESKNTCSTAPGAVLALRAREVPGARASLADTARQLRTWLNATLRDPTDGLYWDNIRTAPTGAVDKTKWSYNSALPLRLELGLAKTTGGGTGEHRDAARQIADASLRHWYDPAQALLRDDASFAHLLAEALLQASEATGDGRYRDAALTTLDTLWTRLRRSDGTYPGAWDLMRSEEERLRKPAQLLAVASVARAYAYAIPYARRSGEG